MSEKRSGGMRKLANDIGMSEANLHRCVTLNKIQASDLERVARLLGVPVGYFFGEQGGNVATASGGSVAAINSEVGASKDERIAHLEELLREKERLIQVLMEKR